MACYSDIDFELLVSTNEAGEVPFTFSRQVGVTPSPGGLPIAIPDNLTAGVTSTLSVATAVNLTDVKVRVEITHTWVGDLYVKLRSPAGTEVVLLDRPGIPPGGGGGCSNDNMEQSFSAQVGKSLQARRQI